MNNKQMRKIVKFDEDKCNGCGLCIPNCAEGAIQIIDGKARLVGENLCDGLGACLGNCPQDAITIEERPAEEFDEQAVEYRKHEKLAQQLHVKQAQTPPQPAAHSGCPGARMRMMNRQTPAAATDQATENAPAAPATSMLGHWPVQLGLVPVSGPIWQNADVLICADCVPFAFPEFHQKLLTGPDGRGRSVAIACPKLDDVQAYVEKLTAIFAGNDIRSITVAHMEVPCCGGIVFAVRQALELSQRLDIPVNDVTVGIDGTLK